MDDALHAWSDPEFWGAEGLGCGLCYVEPAITMLSWGGIGFLCVARWFPEQSEDWLLNWFVRQRVLYLRLKNRKKEKRQQAALAI